MRTLLPKPADQYHGSIRTCIQVALALPKNVELAKPECFNCKLLLDKADRSSPLMHKMHTCTCYSIYVYACLHIWYTVCQVHSNFTLIFELPVPYLVPFGCGYMYTPTDTVCRAPVRTPVTHPGQASPLSQTQVLMSRCGLQKP